MLFEVFLQIFFYWHGARIPPRFIRAMYEKLAPLGSAAMSAFD